MGQVLKELRLLIAEGLTAFKDPRDIVDFCYDISKMTEADDHLKTEIISLLSSLPAPELKWLFTLEKHFKRADYDEFPEDSSIPITGAFLKKRKFILKESEKLYLFDSQGNIKKNDSLSGRSNVVCFPQENPEFYLKQYPEFPGYEFASTLFMRLLGASHLPHQDLVIMNSKYPALLTQAVNGDPVFRIWQYPEALNNLDPLHTGLLIIAAILLNPEDGKEDNFLLSQDGKYLIPIDNDHCFLPSTFQKGKFWNFIVNTALQTKTLLFCLDEMNKPIPNEVKQHILGTNFDLLLQSWLQELVKVEDRYNNLVGQEQRNAFLEKGTVLRIPFYEQFIHNLYWKVNKIQDLLRSASEQTPLSLLRAVESFTARCYQESFLEGNTLQIRFKFATKELYVETKQMSRMSILNTQSMIKIINISEKDLRNDATFHKMGPSDALEVVKQLIEERSQNKKLEQDLLCKFDNPYEDDLWTRLFGDPVLETNLKNFFLNPKEGLVLKGSRLITTSSLINLFAQTPDQGTKIKFLSLPNSPLLDTRAVRALVEGCPNLEYLNVSGCVKLQEISTGQGEWALLTRLEAKDCFNLKKFVSKSPIKILRIGTNQKIRVLAEPHFLEIFTISTKTNQLDFCLKKGYCFEIFHPENTELVAHFLISTLLRDDIFHRHFQRPKITIGTHLISSPKDLEIYITSIDLRNLEINQEVNHTKFQEIVQLNLINLKSLQLPRFKEVGIRIFEDLIQGNWPKLTYLNVFENKIADEGLTILLNGNWPLLEILDLVDPSITNKGVLHFYADVKWPKFKRISLPSSVDLYLAASLHENKFSQVERLELNNVELGLVEVDLISNKYQFEQLKFLDISNNEIFDEGIALLARAEWQLLEDLSLKNTKITSLGIEILVNKMNLASLKKLDISENIILDEGLKTLASANWPSFQHLVYYETQVTMKGHMTLLENMKWQNFHHLEHSFSESFYNYNENSQPEIILATIPIENKTESLLVTVLDLTWFNSKGIYLTISHDGSQERILILPRDKLDQLEYIKLSLNSSSKIQFIICPSTLKRLDVSNNLLSDEKKLEGLVTNCPLLEDLNLEKTGILPKSIEILIP